MKTRPWIWLILANLAIIAGLTTLVVVAIRHSPPEVPIAHGP